MATMLPNSLLVSDRQAVQVKLEQFAHAGPRRLQVVLDFDRTLTINRLGTEEDVTAWNILKYESGASSRVVVAKPEFIC